MESIEDEEAAQRELWTRMRNAVRDVLDQTTLADLLKHTSDAELTNGYMFYI